MNNILKKSKKISLLNNRKLIISLIFIAVFIIIELYLLVQNTKLSVSTYDVMSEKIPNDFNGFKIIQISDFHNTKSKTLTNSIINKIKEEKPNIVAITGDLVDRNRTNINVAIDLIQKIKEIAPIYYVTGNHEYCIENRYNDLKKLLEENGVTVLNNKVNVIEIGQSKINIAGIDDPRFVGYSYEKPDPIVDDALYKLEYDKDFYTILLSHRPEVFDVYVNHGIDLALTGHAHGGQIRVPFIGAIFSPGQGMFPKYSAGKYKENETSMIVSRGIGNSVFPFRINNRPDLVVITLNHK